MSTSHAEEINKKYMIKTGKNTEAFMSISSA
jgi:hypothetical protein